ncbi:hypothetical protein TBLA_0I01100 [Henningerozyma blattae CBS 6284]|uniref:Vacuolar protein sorting-associated protein 20 n=1 Tax=Henningerozyma blattae (strain ATCC 34711 / CBS 6284 / DSM 70876 / NBRC 10599 / NRRL Y-10934 / UCD 77-7) TaxID=1071380 RepID=I2H8R7_HENB6|nr:hypothetical protein TBLA_0I01100 [Tetrapisispora blattae CBS 6284]CCH62769.1 hypothetical protein TBLA_0I01100 [Tetrapisispora blattae CBS 6284]
MGQKNSRIKITETDKAILQLKTSKDQIHRYTKKTNQYIQLEKSQLKQLIQNDPQNYKKNLKIRFLLKRIHYQEHLLQQAMDQLINLENMVSTLEFKLVETQFINGLKNGNEILTKLNKEFTNVDTLMDNVQEQIQYQDEITNILSKSIVGVDFEDELDKELDMIENNLNSNQDIQLPSLKDAPLKDPSLNAPVPVKTAPVEDPSSKEEPLLA